MTPGWDASELVAAARPSAGDASRAGRRADDRTWAELDRRCDEVVAATCARPGSPRAASSRSSGATTVEPSPGSSGSCVPAPSRRRSRAASRPPSGRRHSRSSIPALVTSAATAGAAAAAGRSTAPAVVVLTSGTTARPKGVVLSGAALAASADAWLAALPPATGWLLALGLGHVAGLGVLWRAVAAGVPIRLVDAADPAAQLEALRGAPPVSHVSLVPAQLARLLDAAGGAPPPATLRAVLLGGGAIPAALVDARARRRLAGRADVRPVRGRLGRHGARDRRGAEVPASAGRPLPGVSVDDRRARTPTASARSSWSTPARFDGYLGEPRPTAVARAPIRTGDLGRLDAEGRLFVLDRRTDRIVRGGENVSPAEVEAVLLAMPSIVDAAVVARADPGLGQVPVAAIVLARGAADPGDEAILRACRASLAGFKVPAAIVRLDALPRTAGGKLRREAVRALVDGAPSGILARPDGDEIGWRVTGSGDLPDPPAPGHALDRRPARPAGRRARRARRRHGARARPAGHGLVAARRPAPARRRRPRPRPRRLSRRPRHRRGRPRRRELRRRASRSRPPPGTRVASLAVVAWEPPYGAGRRSGDAARVRRPGRRRRGAPTPGGGAPAAAEVFLRAVAGDAAWDRLPGARARRSSGARATAPSPTRRCSAWIRRAWRGSASRSPCSPAAAASPSTGRSPTRSPAGSPAARRRDLEGLAHPAPDHRPGVVARAIREAIAGSRHPGDAVARARAGVPPMTDIDPGATPSGAATETGNAAPTPEVRAMFDRIARVYDPMNLVISAFQEPYWRRRAGAQRAAATGRQRARRRERHRQGRGRPPPARRARRAGRRASTSRRDDRHRAAAGSPGAPGLEYVVGDALALPTEDGAFDAATIAFGMRNLPDYRRGFAEMARSVRPGGRVLCLEIARPRSRLARFMRWWFDRIVPLIGRVAGQGNAYALPRAQRPGLPVAGAGRGDHARGRPRRRHAGAA